MNFTSFIPLYLYSKIYIYSVVFICFITAIYYLTSNNKLVRFDVKVAIIPTIALISFLIVFLGLRPERSGGVFGDTGMYAHWYEVILDRQIELDFSGEWLWSWIGLKCKDWGFTVNSYFLLIEFFYIGLMFIACLRLMRNNIWVAMLFCLVSFSFYGYAVNGIRNGLACSLLIFAIALLTGNKYEKITSIIIMVFAYFVHHSTILPSLCAVLSLTTIKKPKFAITFWIISVFISLIIGNFFGDLFAELGFDERASYFGDADETGNDILGWTGFRFDFLLYSAMPVLMVWYVTIKRNFNDITYNIIANTYILANAFWIMVIRAEYSNRFAYLSWFLYPLVIAYPLIRMNIWETQDRNAALILLAYSGFTFFMSTIYYG